MKRIPSILFPALLLLSIGVCELAAQTKLAQTGLQFLSVGTDARATAMAEAYTTVEGSAAALFYNPAGMSSIRTKFDVALNRLDWIADINYISGSIAFNPAPRYTEADDVHYGKYGVFGLSFMAVDYGKIIGTITAGNQDGFIETGNYSPNSLVIGLGYAARLGPRFLLGAQAKYIYQNLGDLAIPVDIFDENDSTRTTTDLKFSAGVVAFDFGTIYHTGFKSFSFGMTVRNFARDVNYGQGSENFELPLTFKIGVSMDVLDFLSNNHPAHKFLVSVDAINPRSFVEFVAVGGEYLFMDVLSIRSGYAFAQSDYGVAAGFGVRKFGLALDYSYTPFDVFQDVNRFSLRFSF